MIEKTSRDESFQKTNKTISRFLIVIIFAAVFLSFAVPAEATHSPTSVVVFTDKKTYMGWWVDPTKNGAGYVYAAEDDAPLEVHVYAMVLSEQGTIMKGKEGQLTGYVSDYKRLAPGDDSGHHIEYFGETVFGNKSLAFVDDGSITGDTPGDGIYTAIVTLDKSKGATLIADHMVMNVSVSLPGYTSSSPQQILISGFYCMSGKQSGGGHAQHTDQTGTSANCAVCHHGYEHRYENISGTFSDDQLDIHALKVSAPTVPLANQTTPFDSNRWNFSDDAYPNNRTTFRDQVPGSQYCSFCHQNPGSATYDYGTGDRSDYADRPMCNTSGCHTTTPISGTTVPAWSPVSAVGSDSTVSRSNYNISLAQQHAHDDEGANTVACATCHRPQHSLELPNRTSTDYTDLANRCLSCHTIFNKHNNSVSCINCHTNDTHNIRFLQQDLSYNWSRSNIVTCDNCHTNSSFGGALGLSPPQVPYTNHSTDTMAGQKWGDYWTSVDQSNAVGGSNLITTQTVVVSSSSSEYGSADAISGAQTEDGTYQTLTEGWKSLPPNTLYDYVDSNSTTYGSTSNWNNLLSASDSGAFAAITETIGPEDLITNGGFVSDLSSWSLTQGDQIALSWVDDGLPQSGTLNGNLPLKNKVSSTALAEQTFTVNDTTSLTATLKFKWKKDFATDTPVNQDLTVELEDPSTTVQYTWSDTQVGTVAWSSESIDVSSNITSTGTWIIRIKFDGETPNTGGATLDTYVDDIVVELGGNSGHDVYKLNTVLNIENAQTADNYTYQMNYSTSGDTYNFQVYDGTSWNTKTTLNSASFAIYNYTLTVNEMQGRNPQVRFIDTTQSATQGSLNIEYARITPGIYHQEINLNHNFTGINKYAASEVAAYTLQVKGYVTSSENLHIYTYDYTIDSYTLVKDSAFSTSNGWVNYSIPYNSISDSGNASIQFRDDNKTRNDDVVDNFYLDYVSIKADNSKYLPCFYCHALLANHKVRALGNIEWIQGGYDTNNPMNSTDLGNTYWCANCHYNGSTPSGRYKYNGTAWTPAPPRIDYDNTIPHVNSTTSWFNHSDTVVSNFTDAKCKECHGSEAVVTTKDAPHTVEVGSSGGNNCIECHSLEAGLSGGAPAGINFSAANLSVHYGINSNNATGAGFAPVIGSCWACHDTDGNVSSGHPDLYNTPKTCTDCHLSSGTYYSQTVGWGGLTVSEHYYSGSDISAGNSSTDIASCINCHENVSEMIIYNNDTDTSSFTGDGVRLTGGNLSYYHYGGNKSWTQDTNDYCNQCHNNASTAFPFGNVANKTIANHSSNYPASNPDCSDCHSTGRIHNSTLNKPSDPVGNGTYCLSCHGNDGAGATNFSGAVTTYKEEHNGSKCTECHLNSSRSIHPVRYLQQDGSTWATTNTSAVNCTTCHQNSGLGGDFASAPIVPTPMYHSTDTYSGGLWGNYWDNTSQQSSCDFCHGTSASLHNNSGLGNITIVQGSNTKKMDLTNSRWCANCHYASAPEYAGTSFTLEPPEILNASGNVPATSNDGTNFENHSSYLGSGFNDSDCKSCHNNNLDGAATSLNMSHNVAIGVAGGPNCTNCHNSDKTAPATGALINITATNDSSAIHSNLNIDASTSLPAENKKCWACHGDGTEPSGHPSKYKTPYTCVDCHEADGTQNFNYTPNNTVLNVTQHFWNGTSINTAAVTSCYNCHNTTEMMVGLVDPDGAGTGVNSGANGGNGSVSHYGKKRTDYPTQGTNAYCNQCHDNSSTVFPFANNANKSISNHSSNYPASNPGCNECHSTGRIHNSTLNKPTFALPNSSYCLNCHDASGSATIKDLERHNGSTGLNCTQCHLNATGSIHPVRYLQQDGSSWATTNTNAVNCTTCHQNSGLGGDFASAPIIPTPMYHSTDTFAGGLWNGTQSAFWDNTSQQSSCDYCHGTISLHNTSGLGNITIVLGSNTKRMSLSTSRWCANCHYATAPGYAGTSLTIEPPEILNASGNVPATSNDGTNFVNHSSYLGSGYNDSNCQSCHDNNLDGGATSLNMSHNVAIGVSGGANCTNCHNSDKTAPSAGALINITATEDSNAIHSNLNSNTGTSLPLENQKCWACHGNGSEPGNSHPSRYKTPYTCVDCHESDGDQNLNFTPSNTILNVTQHFWNGTSINTAAVTSCYDCHNKTEMMVGTALDPDGAASFGGANGGNNSVSHYGKKRTDYPTQGTNDYCNQCHNNASTVFTFADNSNKTIANHSSNYPASNPDCDDCHSTGKIHNSTLNKPSDPVGNGTYCLSCHGNDGAGATNFSGAVTTYKEEHNGSKCTECHLNSSRSIHPVRYFNQDNTTWTTTNTSAVNCTTCHQNSGLGGEFASAPIVPTPMNHSTDSYSGTLWNGSQSEFWDNTSQQSSCDYCHGTSALHNSSGLGIILNVIGSNTVRMSLDNSQWCANCHYAGAPDYAGTSFSPEPPEILNASGLVPATSSDGTGFANHSSYLGSGYNDSDCQSCHNNNLDGGATSLNMSHNVAIGVSGGANCTNCHNSDKTAPLPGTLINISATEDSNSIHSNLNSGASTSLPAENKKCWACHGDGTEPSGHPSRYNTPYTCVDCHETDGTQNFNYTPNTTVLNVTQHFWNGTSINTAAVTSCYDCHNKTEMMLGTDLDPDGADSNINGGANGGNASVSHYGKKRTDYPTQGTNDYCNQCHNNGSTVFSFVDNANKTTANHSSNYPASNPDCDDCHSTGRIHNSTLNKPSDPVGNGTYCLSCHGNDGAGATNFSGAVTTYKEEHNGSKCTECHLNSSRSIHPVRYLNQDNTTWATTNSSAVNCTTCHQNSGLGGDFATAPIMPTPIWHSNSSYNGSRWNGTQSAFWDNTNLQTSCDYCHGNVAIHNSSGLGNITLIQSGNSKNQSVSSTSYWCANCHYDGQSPTGNYNYKGNLFSPVPPEIINKTGLVPANSSDGMPFQNHTLNVGGDWSDSRCKTCHVSDATTTGIFAHKLNESQPEAGGKDCLSCHDINANNPNGPPTNRRVNGTAFTNYSVHKNLNSNATPSESMSFNNGSVACWACHSDGTEPIKHPADYLNPKACGNCHVDNAFSAPLVYRHYPDSVFIGSRAYDSTDPNRTCVSCHNNSVVDNLGLSIDSYDATKLKNATAGHYAVNRSFGDANPFKVTGALPNTTQMNGCRECHQVDGSFGASGNDYGNPRSVSNHGFMGSSQQECESSCHNSQPVAVTLHNQSIAIYVGATSCYSTGCHAAPSSGGGRQRRR